MLFSAAVILSVSTLAASSVLEPSTRPADLPVQDGWSVNAICGCCCSSLSYCGKTTDNTTLTWTYGNLTAGDVVPDGTNMTCYLQDRSSSGAADAGLCVPNLWVDFDLTTFCSNYTKAPKLAETIYENNILPSAKTCQPCCDGKSACGAGNTCYQVDGEWAGLCLPQGSTEWDQCDVKLTNTTLTCESCTSLTPAAKHMKDNIQSSYGSGSSGSSGSGSYSAFDIGGFAPGFAPGSAPWNRRRLAHAIHA